MKNENNRITTARTRHGDSGTTEVMSGFRIRKSSDILVEQNQKELCNLVISELLLHPEALDKEDTEILEELCRRELFNLGASIYYKFAKSEFQPQREFLQKIEDRILFLTSANGDAYNFILFDNPVGITFYRATVQFRQLEVYIWKNVDLIYGSYGSINEVIETTASLYNALSDYLYQLTRYQVMKLNTKVSYWEQVAG